MKFSVSTLLVGLVASVDAAGRINRVPDSEWDHILRGSDLLSQRSDEYAKTDGYLVDYDLRSRVVDPSALKVDTVKQLSGYIDDNANDKHLFFCTRSPLELFMSHEKSLTLHRVLRVS